MSRVSFRASGLRSDSCAERVQSQLLNEFHSERSVAVIKRNGETKPECDYSSEEQRDALY